MSKYKKPKKDPLEGLFRGCEAIEQMLNTNPVTVGEEMFGKSSDDFTEPEMRVILNAGEKMRLLLNTALTKVDDTWKGMGWFYYKSLVIKEGFIECYSEKFPRGGIGVSESLEDEFVVYYRPDGLLLVCESYGVNVNRAILYGNLMLSDIKNITKIPLLGHDTTNRTGLVAFTMNADVALFHKIERMKMFGELLPIWEENCFFWLGNRTTYRKTSDRKELFRNTKKMFDGCPEELKTMVAVYLQQEESTYETL